MWQRHKGGECGSVIRGGGQCGSVIGGSVAASQGGGGQCGSVIRIGEGEHYCG